MPENITDINKGDEIIWVDRSDAYGVSGTGAFVFYSGTVEDVFATGISLKIKAAGSLTSPGFFPLRAHQEWVGSTRIIVRHDDDPSERWGFLFLTPDEFDVFKREYVRAPVPISAEDTFSDIPAPEEPAKNEEEEEEAQRNREETFPAEEGSAYDDESLGLELVGLLLQSSLRSGDIFWPEGYPTKWMEKVYNEWLSAGDAPMAHLPMGGPTGGPAVFRSPQTRGIPPGDDEAIQKEIKEKWDITKKAVDDYSEALEKYEAASKLYEDASEDEKDRLEKDRALKQQTLEEKENKANEAKRNLAVAKKKIIQTEREKEKFTAYPAGNTRDTGSGMSQGFYGRQGLLYELQKLSDNYVETQRQIKELEDLGKWMGMASSELNLFLGTRGKRIISKIDEKTGEKVYTLTDNPRGVYHGKTSKKMSRDQILESLRKLKQKQLMSLPYIWSIKRENVNGQPLSERDRFLESLKMRYPEVDYSYLSKYFSSQVRRDFNFFDINYSELYKMSQEATKENPPVPPSEKKARASAYAREYQNYIDNQTRDLTKKTLLTEIVYYFRRVHEMSISDSQADDLNKDMRLWGPRLHVKGNSLRTGEPVEITVSRKELLNDTLGKLQKNFERRALFLKRRQDDREQDQKAARARLKRGLVQRDLVAEQYLRNIESIDLEGLAANLEDLGNRSRKNPGAMKEVYAEDYFLNTEKKVKEIAENFYKIASPEHESNVRKGKFYELKKEVDGLIENFTKRNFEKAEDHLKTIKRYSDRLLTFPVIDEDTYKRSIESLFLKYLKKEGYTGEISKVVEPAFATKHGQTAYNDKIERLEELDTLESAERANIDSLRADIQAAWKPYRELESQFRTFCDSIRGQMDVDKAQERATEFDEKLTHYNEDIANKAERMSEILAFRGSDSSWVSHWQKTYDLIRKAVDASTARRDALLDEARSVFKKKPALVASLESWESKLKDSAESIQKSVEDKEDQLEVHFQNIIPIRKERDKIMDEIGKLPTPGE